MIYQTAQDWQNDPNKRVLLFGMSGLGKTHVSNILRQSGDWFHYSVDYRIGTRYLGEEIDDNLKREAMKNPFLRDLLKSDSVDIHANLKFENLAPLSTFLGKPGDPALGGLEFAEYSRRQHLHHKAEVAALLDTPRFIERARTLYGYGNFICDSGGSICEVVNPDDPNDPVLGKLAEHLLMVWIKGDDSHSDALIRRFDADPKPMCYQRAFLEGLWHAYLEEKSLDANKVNPDDFVRVAYGKALAHRQPRYAAMARNWGISVPASDMAQVRNEADFTALIARSLEKHTS